MSRMLAKLQGFYTARSDRTVSDTLAFEENLRILHFTGLWRKKDEKNSWVVTLRRVIVCYLAFYSVYCIFISIPMYIYLHLDQFSEVSEALGNELTSLMMATNLLTTYLQNDKLNELVQHMRDIYEKHCPSHVYTAHITKSTKKYCHHLSDTLPRVVFYGFWFLGVAPIYSLLKERDISDRFKCWYPFDVRTPIVYEIAVFAFLFNMFLVVINMLATDAFIACMFLHTRAHLKVLQHKLRNLRAHSVHVVDDDQQRNVSGEHQNSIQSWNRKEEHSKYFGIKNIVSTGNDKQVPVHFQQEKNLKVPASLLKTIFNSKKNLDFQIKSSIGECVAHHCEIMQFVHAMEKFWNPVFSAKIIFNLVATVFIMVSPSMKSGDTKAMALLMNVVMFYTEYAMFSYCAEKVTEEMDLLKDALFDCDWLGADKGFKQSMRIVISMANQPRIVRAGGFVPLSMETMRSVMRTAYSYYTVLRNV